MSVLEQLRAQQLAPKIEYTKQVDKKHRVTQQRVDNAIKKQEYVRVGFETINDRKLSGLVGSWNAGLEYIGATAPQKRLAGPGGPKPRQPLVGKGVDNVALPDIQYVKDGQVYSKVVRVTGKWSHVKDYLKAKLNLTEAEAIWNLSTRAYGIHTVLELEDKTIALRKLAASVNDFSNGYKVMEDDLRGVATPVGVQFPSEPAFNQGSNFNALAESSHVRLRQQFLVELGELDKLSKDQKTQVEMDLGLFVQLSGSASKAQHLNKDGSEITKAHKITQARESVLDKLREFVTNGDLETKFFDISKYPSKTPGPNKRPKPAAGTVSRSKKVAVNFLFGGQEVSDIVYTNTDESVVPFLEEIGVPKEVAASIATSVRALIKYKKDQMEPKKKVHQVHFVQAESSYQNAGVTPAQTYPQVAPPELTAVLGQNFAEQTISVPSVGEGLPSVGGELPNLGGELPNLKSTTLL